MKITIVGQGVAGTMLAFELERRGVDYRIIDSGKNHSSAVAAGIMNPVVFRRLTKTWMVDACWDLAIENYRSLEQKIGVSFLRCKPMRRLFASEQERGFWDEKTKLPEFQKYIALFPPNDPTPTYAKNTHGCGLVKKVYHIDVAQFLNGSKKHFEAAGRIEYGEVNYAELLEKTVHDPTQKVIFCQGYRNGENPFFGKLPVQTTKGQILTVSSKALNANELLNRKCFMLPLGEEKFRVGATYEWENTSLHTTEEARLELTEKLNTLIDAPYEIVDQQAGIRPTSPDRRPILGQHPEHAGMYILNGLGTKGYLLAPWCAKLLVEHILEGQHILAEIELKRFKVL